ncbi:MAG: TMEM43 family protein [Akkermansia sp.]|nr:TMEM43 family protein [Akkermansia sp.]
MAYTETTTQSWGSRLGDSIKGIIVGIILFIVSFPLLFWNEGNSVKVAKALEEGRGITVEVQDISKIDPANEGKLVHMCGDATTQDVLKDAEFGIEYNGMMLQRNVEFFQWVEKTHEETKKNMGGSETTVTTYTYEKRWCDKPVDSTTFKEAGHANQVFYSVSDAEQRAENVKYGAFKFSPGMIGRLTNEKIYSLAEYKVPDKLRGSTRVADKYLYIGRPVLAAAAAANAQQPAAVNAEQTKLEIEQLRLQVQQQQLVLNAPAATEKQKQDAQQEIARLEKDLQQKEALLKPAEPIAVQQAKLNLEKEKVALHQLKISAQDTNLQPEQRQKIDNDIKQAELAVQQAELKVKQAELAAQPAAAQQPAQVEEPCSVDPANPQVGDVRITWEVISPKEAVSIVYVQTGDTFTPYHAKSGRDVALLGMGVQTADDLFTEAERNNVIFTWLVRFGGWFLMFIGLNMIFKPLSVLGDVVPFIGTLIGGATGMVAAVIAFILSIITIGIAWIWYRPVLGIALVVVALVIAFLLIKRRRKPVAADAETV